MRGFWLLLVALILTAAFGIFWLRQSREAAMMNDHKKNERVVHDGNAGAKNGAAQASDISGN